MRDDTALVVTGENDFVVGAEFFLPVIEHCQIVVVERMTVGGKLGGLDSLLKEEVHLSLGRASLELEVGPSLGTGPLGVAGYEASTCVVFLPGCFVESHASLEGERNILVYSARLGSLVVHQLDSSVEI